MKITVKAEKKNKSFNTDYYLNTGSVKIQGMILTVFATVLFIIGIFTQIKAGTNLEYLALFLLIPLVIFIFFLLSYLAERRDDKTNVEIDIVNSILRIGKHNWKIIKGKWHVKHKTYSGGRSGSMSFEYFDLIIPTSSSYFPDIKITTEAYILFKEFLESNSEHKISIDKESIFD